VNPAKNFPKNSIVIYSTYHKFPERYVKYEFNMAIFKYAVSYICITDKKLKMSTLSIHTKLETLTPDLKEEVNDFIDFLIEKSTKDKKKKIIPAFGSAKGKIKMSPDFDKPLDDFKDYM